MSYRRQALVACGAARALGLSGRLHMFCRDGALGLTLDPQLMRDLTVLISSSVAGGMLLEAVKQPVINGYFIAGSVVGPGGLQLIKARRGRACECLPRDAAPRKGRCQRAAGPQLCVHLPVCRSGWCA